MPDSRPKSTDGLMRYLRDKKGISISGSSNATGVKGLTFETITDYLVLVIYQLKLLHISKTEMKRVISGFEDIVEKLRSNIPISIFNQIIHTDNNAKLTKLKKFVKS